MFHRINKKIYIRDTKRKSFHKDIRLLVIICVIHIVIF